MLWLCRWMDAVWVDLNGCCHGDGEAELNVWSQAGQTSCWWGGSEGQRSYPNFTVRTSIWWDHLCWKCTFFLKEINVILSEALETPSGRQLYWHSSSRWINLCRIFLTFASLSWSLAPTLPYRGWRFKHLTRQQDVLAKTGGSSACLLQTPDMWAIQEAEQNKMKPLLHK